MFAYRDFGGWCRIRNPHGCQSKESSCKIRNSYIDTCATFVIMRELVEVMGHNEHLILPSSYCADSLLNHVPK